MLECVVKQYHVGILSLLVVDEPVYSLTPVLVDSYVYAWEFLFHLVWLVAYFVHGSIVISQNIPFTLTLISSTEHRHLYLVLQHSDEELYMRSLASATYGDVSYRYDGCVKAATLQEPELKHLVPEVHD